MSSFLSLRPRLAQQPTTTTIDLMISLHNISSQNDLLYILLLYLSLLKTHKMDNRVDYFVSLFFVVLLLPSSFQCWAWMVVSSTTPSHRHWRSSEFDTTAQHHHHHHGQEQHKQQQQKQKQKQKQSSQYWHTISRARTRIYQARVKLFSSSSSDASSSSMELPYEYSERRQFDETLLGDLTGGRPGAIIETAEQLQEKEEILATLDQRGYDAQTLQDYGELAELAETEYDTDDPEALDAATLGTWTIYDLQSKFDYEWDPRSGEPDPNQVALDRVQNDLLPETAKDEQGIEIGYTPYFGPSNPIDTRTILGTRDSYMIDETTCDPTRLTPQFAPDDVIELEYNADVVRFRKSLDLMETFVDPFLPSHLEIPRHVAKWHGYPEQTHFRPQNFTNNRFTAAENRTDFSTLTPFRARTLAVEMARSQNAEWMPSHVSEAAHSKIRAPYEKYQTLVGTLRRGECDPALVEQMQPALQVLGSCVDLLSITKVDNTSPSNNKNDDDDYDDDDNVMAMEGEAQEQEQPLLQQDYGLVIRFHYHGLMKNKYGMKCWTESLLREECGMFNVNNVIFETGFRRRDHAYEGGDHWYGLS